MATTGHTKTHSGRLLQWMPFAIALLLILSMMSEREEWLYVAVVLGVLASIAVGRTLGRSDALASRAYMRTFGKGWVLVVVLASFSLLHGKWQPMVFFAMVGIISTGLLWLGYKSSS